MHNPLFDHLLTNYNLIINEGYDCVGKDRFINELYDYAYKGGKHRPKKLLADYSVTEDIIPRTNRWMISQCFHSLYDIDDGEILIQNRSIISGIVYNNVEAIQTRVIPQTKEGQIIMSQYKKFTDLCAKKYKACVIYHYTDTDNYLKLRGTRTNVSDDPEAIIVDRSKLDVKDLFDKEYPKLLSNSAIDVVNVFKTFDKPYNNYEFFEVGKMWM